MLLAFIESPHITDIKGVSSSITQLAVIEAFARLVTWLSPIFVKFVVIVVLSQVMFHVLIDNIYVDNMLTVITSVGVKN